MAAHSADFGNGGLMMLSAEVTADGTLPASGRVHWVRGFDGNNHETGETPYAGIEPGADGVDPYSTYPVGNNGLGECHEITEFDGTGYPEEQHNGLPVDGQVPDPTFPLGSDGTDVAVDGQYPKDSFDFETAEVDRDATVQYPEAPASGTHDEPDFPEKPACADLIAHTGSDLVRTDYPETLSTDAENYSVSEGEMAHMMVSEWKLIEIDGVKMIEIQLPFMLRHEPACDGRSIWHSRRTWKFMNLSDNALWFRSLPEKT